MVLEGMILELLWVLGLGLVLVLWEWALAAVGVGGQLSIFDYVSGPSSL